MYEKLLPLGSVVLLKGANKRVMVIGRVETARDEDRVYDYAGCLYPEGLLDSESVYFFDQDDISILYFVGFQDLEELRFRAEVLGTLDEGQGEDGDEPVGRDTPVNDAETDELLADAAAANTQPTEHEDDGSIEVAVFAEVEE